MAIYGIEAADYHGLPMMEDWIRRAQAGDVQAARRILEDFIGAVRNNTDCQGLPHRTPSGIGTQIDERAIRYLAECFEKIIDGCAADKALGVKPGEPGRQKLPRQRELDIAVEVAGKIKSGKTVADATQEVAEQYKFKDESRVKKLYYANKQFAQMVLKLIAKLARRDEGKERRG